jgi:hypothetical protein
VDYLYSLYDALLNINVPSDKARAVIDAMERDMGTTLATKTDLQLLRQELRQDLSSLATRTEVAEIRQDLALLRRDFENFGVGIRKDLDVSATGLRRDLDAAVAGVRKDLDAAVTGLRKDMEALATGVRKDMDTQAANLTVRLGSMMAVFAGLVLAALKLT